MPKVVIAVACLGVVVGCAHRTQIVSQPAGASVYVNGTFACTTPCMYETPATQLQPHTPIRLEREGYQPVESELKTGILASRRHLHAGHRPPLQVAADVLCEARIHVAADDEEAASRTGGADVARRDDHRG
jgi:hypothetical protein